MLEPSPAHLAALKNSIDEEYLRWVLGLLESGDPCYANAIRLGLDIESLAYAREHCDPELADRIEAFMVMNDL